MKWQSEEGDKKLVRLEVKYCERCGRMWFRTLGSNEVYCQTCVGAIA